MGRRVRGGYQGGGEGRVPARPDGPGASVNADPPAFDPDYRLISYLEVGRGSKRRVWWRRLFRGAAR